VRDHVDPLDLDVRLARLLATGRYVSTYEVATLDALVQHCLENLVPDDAGLTVTTRDPATRVVETYGPQVRALGLHAVLRQNEQTRPGTATLFGRIRGLRQQAEQQALCNAAQFQIAAPAEWSTTQRWISATLAQQPLITLPQTGGRALGTPFLHDQSWLNEKATLPAVLCA
jgi:hypothetical protein